MRGSIVLLALCAVARADSSVPAAAGSKRTAPVPVEQRMYPGEDGHFDGIISRQEISDRPALHFRRAVSVTAWVQPSRITGMGTIAGKWYEPDSYLLLIEEGNYVFSVAMPGGRWGVAHRVAAPAVGGAWAHVAGVYDGRTLSLYVDGVLRAGAPLSGELQDSNRPIVIGNHPDWNAYEGLIRDVRLYDVALDAGELARQAKSGVPAAHKLLLRLTHLMNLLDARRVTRNFVLYDDRAADCITGAARYERYTMQQASLERFRDRLRALGGCGRAPDRDTITMASLTVAWPGLACDLSECAPCVDAAWELEDTICGNLPQR